MKQAFAVLAVVALVAVGCQKKSETPTAHASLNDITPPQPVAYQPAPQPYQPAQQPITYDSTPALGRKKNDVKLVVAIAYKF